MGIVKTSEGTHPVHTVHRVGIGALGLFLLVFGSIGLIQRLPFASARGHMIIGLSTNGLLATLSLLVSLVLIGAAVRGGHTASTVGLVAGALFFISGIANIFVLGTTMNMLAFQLSNVIFSVLVGVALFFTGAYGRIASHLPANNPYYRPDGDVEAPVVEPAERTPAERITDQLIDNELAEAERAVARHHATAQQLEGVRRAAAFRTTSERRQAFRSP